jgi:hypothetical protein
MGKHTVRFYGLYSTSSKQRHQRCVEALGNLEAVKTPGLTIKDMVLFCRTCGEQATLIYRVWRGSSKGNSINKDRHSHSAMTSYNKRDAVDIANVFYQKISIEIPP